tara:strand:- start:23539 stop:24018 length:480 start_codon:yes stop_codon:yes gene_type:complete
MNCDSVDMAQIDSTEATKICDDELWDRISPDGCKKCNSELPPEWNYFSFDNGHEIVGFWAYHFIGDHTLGIHINILSKFRRAYGMLAGLKLISHIKNNIKCVTTIVAEIPECYPDVIKFTEKFGFKQAGVNHQSLLKNGKNTSEIILTLNIGVKTNGRS